VLPERKIADRTRGVLAARRASANVRVRVSHRVHDPGQTFSHGEHRDENRDDDLQMRNERAHGSAPAF
jgi:hypothetical protein